MSKNLAKRYRQRIARKRVKNLEGWGQSHLAQGDQIVRRLGGIDMSKVLLDFIKPFAPKDLSFEEYKERIDLCTIGWNLAAAPLKNRQKEIDRLVKKAHFQSEMDKILFRDFLGQCVTRYNEKFSHIHRLFLDVKLSDRPDEYSVQVITLPLDQPAEPADKS